MHTLRGQADNSKTHSIAKAKNTSRNEQKSSMRIVRSNSRLTSFRKGGGGYSLTALFLKVSLPSDTCLFQVATATVRREGILFSCFVFFHGRAGETTKRWDKRRDHKSPS